MTISNASASGSTRSINVNFTLENQGSQSVGASTVNYYYSNDFVYDTGDAYLGSSSHGSVPAGGSLSVSKSLLPKGASGTYIIIYADPNNQIDESNESNNTRTVIGAMQQSVLVGGNNYKIYPVPFNDALSIEFQDGDFPNDPASIEILGIDGDSKATQNMNQTAIWNTSNLKKDQYIIKISNSRGKEIVRVRKE